MRRLVLIALAASLGLAYWAQQHWVLPAPARALNGGSERDAASPWDRFITAPVEVGELRRIVSATGTLNATINVEVGSQLSGQIAEVLVDFNERVERGQPLARLDQKGFQARVEEAAAAQEVAKVMVSTARARMDRAEIDARDAEAQRPVLEARTESARVNLESARTTLRRKETLQAQGVGAVAELEDSRTKAAALAAALREAEALEAAHENKVAGARADFRRAQTELEMALASVPQKEALLQVARIDLDRTTIRSPIDGVVVGRNVNVGQTLATTMEAKTVFILAGDLQEMEIHAKVDEADIGKIAAGQDATFTVDAHPGRQFTARVRQLRKAPQVQQNVVTYTVVLSAANRDNLLLPGMTAVVRIAVSRTGPVLKLPLSALRFTPRGGGAPPEGQGETAGKAASIWILGENGEPKGAVVGLGDDDATHAALLSGSLKAGDRVIIGETAEPAGRRLFGIRVGL